MSVKRRKFSIKKTLRIVIPFVLLLVIIFNRYNILYFIQGKISGYNINTIRIFHKFDIYNEIKYHEYSDTLSKIVNSKDFNVNYTKYYLDINYINNDNYFKNINKLIDIGYNANEINTIYKKLDDDSIIILISNEYFKDITNILNLNYFKGDNLLRYINYSKDEVFSYQDNVTFVNIGLDKDFYVDAVKETDTNDILILVNKYHFLDSKYVPSDLEKIDNKYNRGSNNLMRKEAKEAFQKMCDEALKSNIKFYSGSAYRSYNYQLNLYNRYVSADGRKRADTYAARAGHSEHQTGLATDIMNSKYEYISKNDKEYEWLINNSYKYGFILRYPEGKEDITGYMFEEWHFRYVGIDTATNVYNSKLTYDEYMARK